MAAGLPAARVDRLSGLRDGYFTAHGLDTLRVQRAVCRGSRHEHFIGAIRVCERDPKHATRHP